MINGICIGGPHHGYSYACLNTTFRVPIMSEFDKITSSPDIPVKVKTMEYYHTRLFGIEVWLPVGQTDEETMELLRAWPA